MQIGKLTSGLNERRTPHEPLFLACVVNQRDMLLLAKSDSANTGTLENLKKFSLSGITGFADASSVPQNVRGVKRPELERQRQTEVQELGSEFRP